MADLLKSIRESKEFKTAFIGATVMTIFSVAGYFGTGTVEWYRANRQEHAAAARLQDLQSLLKTSDALFQLQKRQVTNLMNLLEVSHPKEFHAHEGYEAIMSHCHGTMSAREREMHGIIRAYWEVAPTRRWPVPNGIGSGFKANAADSSVAGSSSPARR